MEVHLERKYPSLHCGPISNHDQGAKNGQNGKMFHRIARKSALVQGPNDQWCKDKADVNRDEPFSIIFTHHLIDKGEQIGEFVFSVLADVLTFFGQKY